MKIVKPSFEILTPKAVTDAALETIEAAGRTCYKSESAITAESAAKFVAGIIKSGHESVIEHVSVQVRIVCDRGVSHELVRHRIASFSQESTRYCNYSRDKFGNELTFIEPCFWPEVAAKSMPHDQSLIPKGLRAEIQKRALWESSMLYAEQSYLEAIRLGASPQEARSLLPNSLKTEMVMTANLRSWRNFFRLRTAPAAHPQMREIAIPMLAEFKARIPVVFDDISVGG